MGEERADTDEDALTKETGWCMQDVALLEREIGRLGRFTSLIHTKNADIKQRVQDPGAFDRNGDLN